MDIYIVKEKFGKIEAYGRLGSLFLTVLVGRKITPEGCTLIFKVKRVGLDPSLRGNFDYFRLRLR